mmetsp:Transcript_8382/g.24078  ORF Transcript_8382/g.24078 Transcript_8382/m.24078 type:complete len:494 (+) Transcript_8382:633-2114(+)
MLLLADLRGLLHGLRQLRLLGDERLDALAHVRDLRGVVLDLSRQLVGPCGLLVPLQLVGLQLLVAPSLVVRLGGGLLLQALHELLDHLDDLGEVRRGCGPGGQGGEGLGTQRLRTLRQQLRGALRGGQAAAVAAHLQEGRDLTALLREVDVRGVAAGHSGTGDDLDRLADGRELILAHLLVLLVGGGLVPERRLDLGLQLLVLSLGGLRLRKVALRLRGGRGPLALEHGLLVAIRRVLGDGVTQVQLHQAELVRLVGLVLLRCRQFVLELLQQALEQRQHAAGLRLVGGHLWRTRLQVGAAASEAAASLLQERGQHLGHARNAPGHLLQEHLRLRAVVVLRADHLHSPFERVHGLGVVRGNLDIFLVLRLPRLCRLGFLPLQGVDLGVQLLDLATQPVDVAVGLLDEGEELLDLLLAILDLEAKPLCFVVHPLRIGRVRFPLGVHHLFTLRFHLGQHGDDLLRRGDGRCATRDGAYQGRRGGDDGHSERGHPP